MKLLVLFFLSLGMIQFAQAESTRILTCKSFDDSVLKDGFRLNVNLTAQGKFKAVLSSGQTTTNSLHTWDVSVTRSSGKMILVKNLNKTPLMMSVETGINAQANGFVGKAAYTELQFAITPYLKETKQYKINSDLICQVENVRGL